MYKKILVPLDGSKLSEAVFPYAKELAGRMDLDIVFLHVCSPEESELLPMHRVYIERAAEIVKRQSQEVRKRTGIQTGVKTIEAQVEMAVGHPAEEILNYADNHDIDLICMATHGRSGIRRWALGSVADKVLQASKVPVWLVRVGVPEEIAYDKWPRRTILVPLDGSELAEAVLPHVKAVVKQRDSGLVDVVLLRVCEQPLITADYPFSDWEKHVKQMADYFQQEAQNYLSGWEKRLKGDGIKVRSEVSIGRPSDEIIKYASISPFTLIVMATHGRSGLGRWAFGNVADRVLHGVSNPILLVRPK